MGVIHVHSFLGGHSTGTFADIIAGARANGLHFVIMTEHPSLSYDSAAMTLSGVRDGILFVNGNEVSTANHQRLLIFPGNDQAVNRSSQQTTAVIADEKKRGAVVLAAYPKEFGNLSDGDFDGVELYNVFTNARQINPIVTFLDGLWSYRRYPGLMFANFYERPAAELNAWDDALRTTGRKLVATAGNDSHANIGFSLTDSSGKTLLGVKLDPYERSFRLVRMHVLIPRDQPLSTDSLLTAVRSGHCYIGFDIFGDTTGFDFSASSDAGPRIQGDEAGLSQGLHLTVLSPAAVRTVLFKDGVMVKNQDGSEKTDFPISERGVYRVEVYPTQLPPTFNQQPWIISNPIYVR